MHRWHPRADRIILARWLVYPKPRHLQVRIDREAGTLALMVENQECSLVHWFTMDELIRARAGWRRLVAVELWRMRRVMRLGLPLASLKSE